MGGENDPIEDGHTFGIKYRVTAGQFKVDDREPLEGLTDALVMMSIIYPGDGSSSTMIMSSDSRKESPAGILQPLPSFDTFKAWSMLAKELSEDVLLPENLRVICNTAFESVREFILANRG